MANWDHDKEQRWRKRNEFWHHWWNYAGIAAFVVFLLFLIANCSKIG